MSTPSMQPDLMPEKGLNLLQRQRKEGLGLEKKVNGQSYTNVDEVNKWILITSECISNAFGKNSEEYKDFKAIPQTFPPEHNQPYLIHLEKPYSTRLLFQKGSHLEALIQILEMRIDSKENQIDEEKQFNKSVNTASAPATNEVFLVHGHDHGTLQTVARFIEKLKLTPIILHEKANKGQTIIEKFEEHSDVGFAVVLLTPDDQGGKKDCLSEKMQPRARQNVILELGFFMGKLGRERVSSLYVEGVEIPSDYKGVLFTPLDSHDSWHLKLAKELKTAGFNIDLNSLAN